MFEGNSDLHNGVEFGWLYTLSVTSRQPFTHILYAEDNKTIYRIEVSLGTFPPQKINKMEFSNRGWFGWLEKLTF